MASDQAKTPADIEREQEALLKAKYGGLLKRKQPLMPKDHKYFDSADWALAKEGKGEPPAESLPPRTSPAAIPAAHPHAHALPQRPGFHHEGAAGPSLTPEHPQAPAPMQQ